MTARQKKYLQDLLRHCSMYRLLGAIYEKQGRSDAAAALRVREDELSEQLRGELLGVNDIL